MPQPPPTRTKSPLIPDLPADFVSRPEPREIYQSLVPCEYCVVFGNPGGNCTQCGGPMPLTLDSDFTQLQKVSEFSDGTPVYCAPHQPGLTAREFDQAVKELARCF